MATTQVTDFTMLKDRTFNLGNKTARVMRQVGVGKDGIGRAYAWEERVNRNATADNNAPLLYFVCEVNGKKGVTIKCNDDEFLRFAIQNPKPEYVITFKVEVFMNEGRETIYASMTGIN